MTIKQLFYVEMEAENIKKQICICDHCGAEFNPINGYSDMEIDDFDFIKVVDLCTDCHQELCDIIRDFIHEDASR